MPSIRWHLRQYNHPGGSTVNSFLSFFFLVLNARIRRAVAGESTVMWLSTVDWEGESMVSGIPSSASHEIPSRRDFGANMRRAFEYSTIFQRYWGAK